MDNRKRLWLLRGAIILLALAALVGWWLIPGVRSFVQHSFSAFATLDQQALERFIHAYGPLAALVSFGLMILQAIVAPLPAFLITFANASLSAHCGAAYCHGSARWLARRCAFLLPAYWAVKW